MSLLRRAGRVAVASSIHGSVQQRQSSRWAAQAAQQAPVAQSASPASGPTSTGASPAVDPAQRIALLKELAELHTAGVLTDAEFSAQKAALLA